MMSSVNVWTILLALGIGSAAMAQEPTTRPADAGVPVVLDARPAATQPAGADPTQPGLRLRAFLNAAPGSAGRLVAEEASLPRMVKRGFFQTDGGKPEALIEIDGAGLFSVQEGSTVSVTTSQGATLTFRVTKVSADQIEIEGVDSAAGRKITVR